MDAKRIDKKVSCSGDALAFSEPEKSPALIKDIIESAYDRSANMIVTLPGFSAQY